METLYNRLINQKLTKDEVMICFLGQAGVLIKSFPDRYIAIDPYLTNFCEEKIGLKFKRLIPQLIDLEEIDRLKLDAYLLTHHHEDHLDAVAIRSLKDVAYPFYAPPVSMDMLNELGIDSKRVHSLSDGAVHQLSDEVKVYGVFADHGEHAPDAVGIIVEINGKVIYHMGDTCLNREEFSKIQTRFKIDLLFVPINGRYGNMDAIDGAEAVKILKPRYAAPCHFWMLPGNSGGDPELFIDKVTEIAPQSEVLLLAAGEMFKL